MMVIGANSGIKSVFATLKKQVARPGLPQVTYYNCLFAEACLKFALEASLRCDASYLVDCFKVGCC